MKPFLRHTLVWVMMMSFFIPTQGLAVEDEEEIDHVKLAAILVKDGHYARALTLLREVKPKTTQIDWTRYYTLQGLASLHLERYAQAIDAFKEAVIWEAKRKALVAQRGEDEQVGPEDELTPLDPLVHIFWGQAAFELGDCAQMNRAFDTVKEKAQSLVGTFLLRIRCAWKDDNKILAFRLIDEALSLHPSHRELMRQKVFLLVNLGLFQEALVEGRRYLALSQNQGEAQDYVVLAKAMRKAKAYEQAINLLEEARLRFPRELNVAKMLGHIYLDAGKPLSAAKIYERAMVLEPKLAVEVGELYRRAGKPIRALYFNGLIKDQKAKFKQRMALMLDLSRFEELAAMAPRLIRLGLMEDENLRYALAYAYFMTRDFTKATKLLRGYQDPILFKRAIALREAMDNCKREGWKCL